MSTINIGKAGTRVVISGVIEKVDHFGTQWGNETHLRIRSSDGVYARWKAASYLDVQPGQTIDIRATVREYRHDDKTGETYVDVTRGQVMEDVLTFG